MKVLLIWPSNPTAVLSNDLSCCEPLPLEYLAGSLRARHEVRIVDLRFDRDLKGAGWEDDPDLIGLAIPYTTIIPSAFKVACEVRRIWPNTPLVIGGHHPTMSREWLEKFPVDYVAVGESAQSFRELANQIESFGKMREPIVGIANLQNYLKGIPKAGVVSLDEISMPDRSLLARHHNRYFHSIYRPVALVRFSAGCPYHCKFCSLWKLTDRQYLIKSWDRIISELTQIAVQNVYVVDDEAFIQPERMLGLADAIEQAGLRKRYHMYLRADTAARHPHVIERWAELGLDSVLVGVESMSDQELREYRKGAPASETRTAINLFHRLKIKIRANFIIPPNFEMHDFKRLADTVDELEIDLPSYSVLTPLPGTDLYAESQGEFISDNPELYDCYHTLLRTRLPLEDFYSQVANLLFTTAQRGQSRSHTGNLAPMFYFSSSPAFEKMISSIRDGHRLNRETWNPVALEEPVGAGFI